MLTRMTEDDWGLVLQVFNACRTRRGDRGRNDRKFLEALYYWIVRLNETGLILGSRVMDYLMKPMP